MRDESELTDADVMANTVGRPDAFLEIFDRHFESVFRYVARRVGPSTAEDVAAEVFARAMAAAHTYRPQASSALPWLFGIATNVLRGELRRHYPASDRGLGSTATQLEPRTEDDLESVGTLAEVERALSSLSVDEREPLLLFAWADQSYEEIALALAVPIGTVRSRIARARRHLRRELGLHADRVSVDGADDLDPREA